MASGDARLSIAGSSSAVPRPGRANSAYLFTTAAAAVGLDFGSGAFSKMRQKIGFIDDIDAILISHMHADHFLDLIPLRYALRYEFDRPNPLKVYVPPAGIKALTHIVHPFKETDDFFDGVMELHEYSPGTKLEIGDCTITFAPTRHYIPAYAMRVECPDGTFAFSSDTAPCESVPVHAAGSDMFLCECALGARGAETGSLRGHLNAEEAGAIATAAGVKHLVLTHYGTGADPGDLRAAAGSRFAGPITVADDGLEIPLVKALADKHV